MSFRSFTSRWVFTRHSFIVALVVFIFPGVAFAAGTLSVSPGAGSYGAGKTFTIEVIADADQAYNSGSGALTFPKDILSVSSISKTTSAFSLWAVEPKFSNADGTVSFEGGNASPITGKKNVISITFKALKEGKADVAFSGGTLLAADGKGTDIVGAKTGGSFDVTAGAPDKPATPSTPKPDPVDPVDEAANGVPKPDAPEITSPTHPEENKWYNPEKAKFVWDMPPDITADRLQLDTTADTIPVTNYDPAISEKEFGDLSNGTMYFHLRYKNDAGWGPTTHRKIMVDKTPPEPFTLELIPDPAKEGEMLLKFMATDTLSGLDRYTLTIDGTGETKIGLIEVKDEGYVATSIVPGDHTFLVKAFDKAGNSAEAEKKGLVPGTIPVPAGEEPEEKPTDWKLYIIIGLIAVIGFMVGYLVYERSAFRHEKFVTKREADETRDTTANIFAALRDEVGEQVGLLYEKPNPSALDREVMQRINEALDLSEELIAKEVEDVRKMLS